MSISKEGMNSNKKGTKYKIVIAVEKNACHFYNEEVANRKEEVRRDL